MTDKKFTRKEVAEQGNKQKVLTIIDNRVYDLSTFIDEHPGGHEVLVGVTGQDASEDFSDASHTQDAKDLMVKYRVGELVDEDRIEEEKVSYDTLGKDTSASNSHDFFYKTILLPMIMGIVVPILYVYLFG